MIFLGKIYIIGDLGDARISEQDVYGFLKLLMILNIK